MKGWAWLLLVPVLVAGALYGHDLLLGLHGPYGPGAPSPKWPELGTPWAMWPVDNPGDWLPNGLDTGDVTGDGFPDFLVNYEFRGRIRVVLHPGRDLRRDRFWPAVDVGLFPNAESAAFGDLDRDGTLDIVVVQGIEHHGDPSAVRILWGEAGGRRWADRGPLPGGVGLGQYLYVRVADLDRDGFLDIVVGGRAARLAGGPRTPEALAGLPRVGLRLFRNPLAEGRDPRDPGAWSCLPIDPEVPSGHGFVLADLDGDGLLDLVVNNADWDTLDEEEAVLVYRNPGPGSLSRPWPRLVIYASPEFYGKEQVAVGDLDGDGRPEVVAQAEASVHIFWNRSRGADVRFERESVPKPAPLRWRARPIALADLNGDGRLDIVGAAIHRDGVLPREVAAVWWLERTTSGWVPHVIKWGSGFVGLGAFNGEKWDQIVPLDVDGDGDLDLVANVEEMNRLRALLAVVWFENPTR